MSIQSSSSSSTTNAKLNAANIGLYFGGSSMTIAYYSDNDSKIVVNEAGDRTTPTVIGMNHGEFSVGLPAKQNLIRNASNTVCYSKHFIGVNKLDQISDDLLKKNACQIVEHSEQEIAFEIEKNENTYKLTLSECIEQQIKFMNDLAKASIGVKDCNTVISVPNYFTSSQTEYLKERAINAGFNVIRTIKNPIAACLAYDIEDDNSINSYQIVYKMGGNSVEVTLVEITNGLYRIIDSYSDFKMGGDLFTFIISDILCEEFTRKHKMDPKSNKRSMFKLNYNAQELKHILSTMERAHCSIDALYDGVDFDFYLTRQRFETGCKKLYEKITEPIDQLLSRNNMNKSEISRVILSGAATKMCRLQSRIKDSFPESTKLLNYKNSDEISALGCAKQAFLMSNTKVKDINQDILFKSLSKALYLKIGDQKTQVLEDGSNKLLIAAANCPLPIKRSFNLDFNLKSPFLCFMEDDVVLAKVI
jgi:molecular chaperone DnaK (HSP70)